MPRKPRSARKVVKSTPVVGKGARYRVGEIEFSGHRFVVWVDPKLKIEGLCDFASGEIVLRPQVADRMAETLMHEVLHATIDASGLGWLLRRRFRMSESQRDAFEEDVIRVLSPALFASLRGAGWLRFPRLPRPARHHKS